MLSLGVAYRSVGPSLVIVVLIYSLVLAVSFYPDKSIVIIRLLYYFLIIYYIPGQSNSKIEKINLSSNCVECARIRRAKKIELNIWMIVLF